MADIPIEQILNSVIKNKEVEQDAIEYSEEQIKKILGSKMQDLMQNKNKKFFSNLTEDINKLKKLVTDMENFEGSLQWWNWHVHITLGKEQIKDIEDENLIEAFDLINKISATLRGEEEIILRVVVRNDKTGRLEVFEIPEHLVKKNIYRGSDTDEEGKTKKVNEIRYSLEDVKKNGTKMKVSQAFEDHYSEFTNVAERLKKQNKNRYSGLNKGHIAEAFYAHFNYVHNEADYTNNNLFDQNKLTGHEVGPALWAAKTNKIGWWAAGDVENIQIKTSKNLRLASIQSIKILANQLLSLFGEDSFNWENFEKIYTEKGQLAVQEQVKESLKNKT